MFHVAQEILSQFILGVMDSAGVDPFSIGQSIGTWVGHILHFIPTLL